MCGTHDAGRATKLIAVPHQRLGRVPLSGPLDQASVPQRRASVTAAAMSRTLGDHRPIQRRIRTARETKVAGRPSLYPRGTEPLHQMTWDLGCSSGTAGEGGRTQTHRVIRCWSAVVRAQNRTQGACTWHRPRRPGTPGKRAPLLRGTPRERIAGIARTAFISQRGAPCPVNTVHSGAQCRRSCGLQAREV